jgi:hypothetical protein
MDRLTRIALGLGIVALMMAVVLILEQMVESVFLLVAVSVACALLFFAIFRAYLTRKGEIYKDERTQKIHNSALAISWWVAYVVLAGVYLLSIGGALDISLNGFVPLMFFLMIGTYWVAKTYLSHRGEPG